MAGIAWRSLGIPFIMLALARTWTSYFVVETTAAKFGPSLGFRGQTSVAILLAAKEGPEGDSALQEWSSYLRHSNVQAAVWVVCSTNTRRENLVRKLSNLLEFPVKKEKTWATAIRNFRLMNSHANVFGLLGEGVLPPPDLVSTILKVESAITAGHNPTAVLARSRSRATGNMTGTWLPDTFIAQLWCNRKMLTGSGLEDVIFPETSFLHMLPIFIAAHREIAGLVEVDGTSVINATYDVPAGEWTSLSKGNAAAADGGNLYLGMLDLVLTVEEARDDEGQVVAEARIEVAPWPPRYILDMVQGEDGLVILNSVNCGYLDFATNFLRSVRRVTNSKKEVLWVAMDEVAFDFMDALSPGTAVLFSPEGSERHHAVRAGKMGDDTFKSQVLVRPNILLHILNEGYTLLWTDSDMVWLNNPLPLLPDINDPEAAELLLQHDGSRGNPCTCFLFMKPTKFVKQLLELWIEAIIDANSWYEDQIPFRGPLHQQLKGGLRMDVFPKESFPSGKFFFAYPYEEDYAHVHYPDIMIVHNNYIKGHDAKLERFQEYHLWDVENVTFPTCGRRHQL